MTVVGFPPLVCETSRVLILGTLPGAASLKAGQYYAAPRNAFWRIMEEVAGVPASLPYAERSKSLLKRGVAIWDVMTLGERIGSLDGDITSFTPNDFCDFFDRYRVIELVCLNGRTAAASYEKIVHRTGDRCASVQRRLLPSTSAAHAIPMPRKLEQWMVIREHLRG